MSPLRTTQLLEVDRHHVHGRQSGANFALVKTMGRKHQYYEGGKLKLWQRKHASSTILAVSFELDLDQQMR